MTPRLLEVTNDWEVGIITKRDDLLMDHKSKNSHHGGTAVVKLDGALGKLGLFIKVIPSEVNVAVTEVSNVLVSGSGNITHEGDLQNTNGGNHLDKSGGGDGVGSEEGGNTVGEGVEGVSSVVDGSWKMDSGAGHNLAQEGKLRDTSVLDLDVSEAVEALLGDVTREQAEGIEEPKWRLGTKLILEGGQRGGGLGDGGRREGGGGGDGGGEDDRLHGSTKEIEIMRGESDDVNSRLFLQTQTIKIQDT